jgi:hypothetical protein
MALSKEFIRSFMPGMLVLLSAMFVHGQQWNPYVGHATIAPDPLMPMEFKGAGVLSFQIGNQGDPLPLIKNQEMTLVITLVKGIPATSDPLAGISGPWAGFFEWSYEKEHNSYRALQIKDIPGNSSGFITIEYQVTVNTAASNPGNGFNVNLQPPPYANGINSTADDAVSGYTYVMAKDYGDAPASYGSASHDINIFKNPETGEYENYIYLGSAVNPEPGDLFSSGADGDDLQGINDDDGVAIPVLYQGDTVTIPVVVTVHDVSAGTLNAWFDWKGDGNFSGEGKKITGTPLHIFQSGTYELKVQVPDSAITSRPTFARFRIGANGGPVGHNAWGEVEDYMVIIKSKTEKELQPAKVEENLSNPNIQIK